MKFAPPKGAMDLREYGDDCKLALILVQEEGHVK